MNAQQLFEAWSSAALAKDTDAMADLYAEDGEHQFPFRDGTPTLKGREVIRAHLAGTFGKIPVELHNLRSTVHQTTDPNTIVVECTFEGLMIPTGAPFSPSYVEVITARDGKIALVRDYENLAYRSSSNLAPAAPAPSPEE